MHNYFGHGLAISGLVLSMVSSIYIDIESVDLRDRICASIYCAMFWLTLLLPRWRKQSNSREILLTTFACVVIGFNAGIASPIKSFFAIYSMLVAYFHFSEFMYISLSHGYIKFDQLMVNHSREYAAAFTISMLEYFISPFRLPSAIRGIGIVTAVLGLFIRGSAMVVAGRAFTHLIAKRRSHTHRLVTSGPYQYMRHPGYCGWFFWAVGSQLILGNPVCTVAFVLVNYSFFKERIQYEEEKLVEFFEMDYIRYMAKTPFSGVPFIK